MKAKIVLIEDDEDLRLELQDFLTRRRHEVRACGTLAEAAKTLLEYSPDIVLSDINLPDGDGAVFCMSHTVSRPRTKWLLMSGNQDLLRQSRTIGSGGPSPFAVLDKPVPLRVIDDFIRVALAARSGAERSAPPLGADEPLGTAAV